MTLSVLEDQRLVRHISTPIFEEKRRFFQFLFTELFSFYDFPTDD